MSNRNVSLFCLKLLNENVEMLSTRQHDNILHKQIISQYDICCHCLSDLMISSTPVYIKYDILAKFLKYVNVLSAGDIRNPLIYLSYDINFFTSSVSKSQN
ncbi:hypothetical protein BMR1_02g01055 [Babesia microti strain RI]|uniref:Uncharacterized protein n=1 Tax=Babesia microti (strain RI) TaxID=1133968 RepID=I7IQ08_BABMR|nr:hypothetical protein BMR1_02g01055 [Babesia microti strain RI]CCF73375.1 hypothetical protein BMR1_02g01055 [Babesia microti strain RI]|eukprot:XP_012647984.1 hypothetical protein BMR1_02g01055 [Babesia microti strain RI]